MEFIYETSFNKKPDEEGLISHMTSQPYLYCEKFKPFERFESLVFKNFGFTIILGFHLVG